MVGKSLAVIPARGGSKRLPGKNIIKFAGKPMIAWTIEAAINSGCFERVIVSTDDDDNKNDDDDEEEEEDADDDDGDDDDDHHHHDHHHGGRDALYNY